MDAIIASHGIEVSKGAFTATATANHSATVIFLHGLGDTGLGWSLGLSELREGLEYVKFVCPNAGEGPVTVNGGMVMPRWFDLVSMDHDVLARNEDIGGYRASIGVLEQLIDEAIASGIPPERICVGGFSQGGVVSIMAVASQRRRLGGLLCLSTWLGDADRTIETLKTSVNRGVPAFWGVRVAWCGVTSQHGLADPMVPWLHAKRAIDAVTAAGIAPEVHTYAALQHSSAPEVWLWVGDPHTRQEMSDVQTWLRATLPPI